MKSELVLGGSWRCLGTTVTCAPHTNRSNTEFRSDQTLTKTAGSTQCFHTKQRARARRRALQSQSCFINPTRKIQRGSRAFGLVSELGGRMGEKGLDVLRHL